MLKHLLITAPDFVAAALGCILSILLNNLESRFTVWTLLRYPKTDPLYEALVGTNDFLELNWGLLIKSSIARSTASFIFNVLWNDQLTGLCKIIWLDY